MADLKKAAQLFQQLKAADSKGDETTCKRLLSSLKLLILDFPAVPPTMQQTSTAQQELKLARDVLEFAVLSSVKHKDDAGFERNFSQLRTYYTDTRSLLPPSEAELLVTGLNLLRLLVQNRIAEFHTELELLPQQAQKEPYVREVIQLEQWLMEGAYNKVLAARQNLPAPQFAHLMDLLATTVRDEVAGCSEEAYTSLKLDHARQLLMFEDDEVTSEYAAQRGWEQRDGQMYFQPHVEKSARDLKSVEVIGNSLTYARELERIV